MVRVVVGVVMLPASLEPMFVFFVLGLDLSEIGCWYQEVCFFVLSSVFGVALE